MTFVQNDTLRPKYNLKKKKSFIEYYKIYDEQYKSNEVWFIIRFIQYNQKDFSKVVHFIMLQLFWIVLRGDFDQ